MEEVGKQVKENEMPLSSYTLIHTNARLSPQQKNLIIDWANMVRNTIKFSYPADSLTSK